MMPSGWERKKLGEITELLLDGTHFSPKSKTGPYKYITSKNIRFGRMDLNNISYISKDEHEAIYKRCPVQYGDLLFTKDGANTGNAALNELKEEFSLLSSVALIRANPQITSNIFLLQTLLSSKYQVKIKDEMAGQAITRLTLQKIKSFEVMLPPKEEQEKIVQILSTWDDAIEKLKKILAIKNTEFTWFINEAIVKSQKYPMMTIDDLFDVGRGRVISKGEIQKNFGEYPVYSSQTSNDGIFGHLKTYDFDGEYLSWTTDGANAGAVFYRNGKFNCTNVCGTLKQKYNDISPLFISYLLRNITPKHVSKNLANPKLMNGVMKAIKINVPPLGFQRSTAKLFQTKKNEIDLITKKVELVKAQKRGLMQQLLTGRKRVKL